MPWVESTNSGNSWVVVTPAADSPIYAEAGEPMGLLLTLTYPFQTLLRAGGWSNLTNNTTTWTEV